MRGPLVALLCLALALTGTAQQPNSPSASLMVNGIGAAPAPGPFQANVSGGSTVTLTLSGPAATPFVIVNANPGLGGTLMPGVLATPFGFVDIGPPAFPPLEVVADGMSASGVLSWIFRTGASGSATFPVTLPAGGCGSEWANLQGIFPNPATLYTLTAATRIYSGADVAPVTVPTGDDTSHAVPLLCGSTFTFYGIPYPTVYVNSNGNLTFGGFHTSLGESQSGFNTGLPKICQMWDDLYPVAAGSVTKLDDGVTFTVAFTSVPEYSVGGSNSVTVTLTLATGDIAFTYGACSVPDCLVGITPGGGLATPVTVFGPASPLGRISDRLAGGSLGPYSGGVMESMNELFAAGATAFNLAGTTVNFTPSDPGIMMYTLY